jgi:Mn2+/Fe2+ NRAMP family transporter
VVFSTFADWDDVIYLVTWLSTVLACVVVSFEYGFAHLLVFVGVGHACFLSFFLISVMYVIANDGSTESSIGATYLSGICVGLFCPTNCSLRVL